MQDKKQEHITYFYFFERITDHGSDNKLEDKPAAGVEKWGGAEKLLYAGGPELSSQVLEGNLHL